MSPPGRPKGEYRSAQHEGTPVSPPGRPKGEYRSAQHEGTPVSPPDRPKGEYRSAQHEGTLVSRRLMALAAAATLVACTSPEADRVRGGGPGADVGNRGDPIVMHEGSRPYEGTPKLIASEAPPVESANQAQQMSLSR
mgnify:CR=1 FL=1